MSSPAARVKAMTTEPREETRGATDAPADGLWSRLRLIEGQPLSARAEAYAHLHDELSRRLDSGARLDQHQGAGDR